MSEFSVTPTNSLTDDEGGDGNEGQAHSPDHIQRNVELPWAQITGYPVEVEAQPTPMPFPPTPEPTEVSEPGPVVTPHSYKDIKDSLYFQERMVKTKEDEETLQKGEGGLSSRETALSRDPSHSSPQGYRK